MRALLLLLVLILGAAGCQTMNPETRAASDQWRMESLEENFLEFKEARQAEQAEAEKSRERLEERMMALEEQMAALRGEVGEAREQARAAAAQPLSQPVMAGPQSSEEKPWAQVPTPVVTDTPKMAAAPKPKPVKPAARPAAASGGSAATALYEKGQRLAAAENAEEARKVLDSFLAKYPSNRLVPNALYWKGEAYYAQKDYPQAILAFKEVTRRFPKHAKAQAALLKIGMSYKNVDDTDNAVFYLRTLVDEHPSSEPARLARKILQEIPG